MSVPFRERNPVIVGAVSLAVIFAFILAAFRAEDLPVIGGGDTYYAAFAEAGGLTANDEVRIAGVRVGKVKELELDDGRVKVTFQIQEDAGFGPQSRAAIKVKTLLGSMYLELIPAGAGQLESGATIPAGGSCTVTVNVTSATAGAYANSIPAGALITALAFELVRRAG